MSKRTSPSMERLRSCSRSFTSADYTPSPPSPRDGIAERRGRGASGERRVYTRPCEPYRRGLLLIFLAAPALAAAPSAPAFTIKLLDDSGTFDSRAAIGKKILVVRFQASWCKACAEEAAGIERLYEKYGPRGVEVVAIHIQDTAADARQFLKDHGAKYPAGLDPHLTIANRFGWKGAPYTIVISKKGEMVARIHGRADEARLTRVLDPLLGAPPTTKPPGRP